ncbi:hypothetical protein P167DRAFT_534737 [Morchella conica CCBAS932]|uniref:Uncharacterized protein n=1 Tax=Morchella conica CCBAS932 TaxID=1392247 RepID=A0A3N4KWT8_9PEZI|nr:hypothetical protein P167DRAFT_534737 [Morchella conica CCBAS932]
MRNGSAILYLVCCLTSGFSICEVVYVHFIHSIISLARSWWILEDGLRLSWMEALAHL